GRFRRSGDTPPAAAPIPWTTRSSTRPSSNCWKASARDDRLETMFNIRPGFILPAVVAAGAVSFAQTSPPRTATAPTSIVERVGDTGFIQLRADGFRELDPRQQTLAYWLTQASIAIDPIIYDQVSQYGLRQK